MEYPKMVFIIPYRDREEHYIFFTRYMKFILEDYEKDKDYQFCFVHQNDDRKFNRGALKNIGFIYYREKYPKHYKNIQFIFHDIDTIPYTKELWNYETKIGSVKHFYGYKFALGGIITIYGEDFEKTNGYPCFWSWGFEDNILQQRVKNKNIKIDRSEFLPIQSMKVLHFFDGVKRNISIENISRIQKDDEKNGIETINNIEYMFDDENHMLQVYNFDTLIDPDKDHYVDYNIQNGTKIYKSNLVKQYNETNEDKILNYNKLAFTNIINKGKKNKKSK